MIVHTLLTFDKVSTEGYQNQPNIYANVGLFISKLLWQAYIAHAIILWSCYRLQIRLSKRKWD